MSNTITVNIGGCAPDTYLRHLHSAICQVKMIAFSQRELELDETQNFALYILTDLQQRLISERNRP